MSHTPKVASRAAEHNFSWVLHNFCQGNAIFCWSNPSPSSSPQFSCQSTHPPPYTLQEHSSLHWKTLLICLSMPFSIFYYICSQATQIIFQECFEWRSWYILWCNLFFPDGIEASHCFLYFFLDEESQLLKIWVEAAPNLKTSSWYFWLMFRQTMCICHFACLVRFEAAGLSDGNVLDFHPSQLPLPVFKPGQVPLLAPPKLQDRKAWPHWNTMPQHLWIFFEDSQAPLPTLLPSFLECFGWWWWQYFVSYCSAWESFRILPDHFCWKQAHILSILDASWEEIQDCPLD